MEFVSNQTTAGWWGPPCKQPTVRVRVAGNKITVARGARRLFRWMDRVFSRFPKLYADMNEKQLDDWGGMCRNVTGYPPTPVTIDRASKHAFYLAADTDADENVRGTDPFKSEIWVKGNDGRCVRILEATGFTWGGRFNTPDPHHWEVAVSPQWIRKHFTIRGKPKRWFRKQLQERGITV